MEKFVLLLIATLTAASHIKPYRTDYTYNPQSDAFYKLHIENRGTSTVRGICELEGAKLMRPSVPEDLVQLHGMMKQYPDLGDVVLVESDGQDHASAEEVAIIDLTPEPPEDPTLPQLKWMVINRRGERKYVYGYNRELPFICKVDAKDAPYDSHCQTFGRNYHYEPSVGSCYRVSNYAYSWNEAYAECRAENAHLVVINSQAEQEVVHRLLQAAPRVKDSQAWFFYFAGFRAAEPPDSKTVPVFKTIFNETLEEAGCGEWSPNEPNNAHHEYCGTIFVNDGKFNDVNCSHKFGFVCENNKN